jgi:uncharacterized membrane protein
MGMDLPLVIQAVRWTHILAGFMAFFIAPVPLLTAKGGKTHRRWGKVYFWAMAVVAATAMVLALWRPVLFLAFISVFSFYVAFRGYRVLSRKNPSQGRGPGALDWTAAVSALLGGIALIVFGTVRPNSVWAQLGAVPIVFGVLSVVLSANDIRTFIHPPADKRFWWYAHMGGMIGSYIAAVSAFSVVNLHFLPTAIRWLWPSALGVPGIFIWIGHYKRKFGRADQPSSRLQRGGEI